MDSDNLTVNRQGVNVPDGNICLQKLFLALSRIVGDNKLDMSLTEALAFCDQLANQQDSGLDSRLHHYLERRSYRKAHKFVQEIL